MRIPSLPILCVAFCLSSAAFADLSPSDLPYLQGTPIADGAWEIQDYAQGNDGIQWIWLQKGANSAYVIYPSEESVLLPDNSLVPAGMEQMTLRFAGDAEQELVFTRFGSAQFTLVGDTAEVRYTAVVGNAADGAYPGDLNIEAREIHVEGELTLEGSLALDAGEMLALYGAIDVQDQISVNASAGVIIGSVRRGDSIVMDACGIYTDSTSIHIETSNKTKGCLGDVVLLPEAGVEPKSEAISPQASAQNSSSSKGGSADGWFLMLMAIFSVFARVGRK
ncbi:MAG: hypothetical protein NVV73_21280 [Cellvibrionaceae bacterium]|nr:hypothetical protein [Cellvibrionaceae bacterium]